MDIQLLISNVFMRPAIWDKRDKLHSNRNVVERCWKEIAAEMGKDELSLRKKWKYLRDQFATEYHKNLNSLSDTEQSGSKWPYLEPLMFLKEIMKTRTRSEKKYRPPMPSTSVLTTSGAFENKMLDFEKVDVMEERQERSINDDELFVLSLVPHLQKLPDKERMFLKKDIMNMVCDRVYGND